MAYLFALVALPWIVLPYRWLQARPLWGVGVALVPSIFLTEDLHENFFVSSAEMVLTFHSIKLAGFFRPTEFILILLTLILLSRYPSRKNRLKTPLDIPVKILLVALPLAAVISMMRGADPIYAFAYNMWRTFWWSLVFFYFCIWAIQESEVEKAFSLFYVALVIRMLFGVTKFLLGFGETHVMFTDTQIVFWDGLDLHLASSLVVMSALLLASKSTLVHRPWLVLGLFLSVLTVMYSLRRSPIANIVIAFTVLLLVFPIKDKGKILFASLLILLVGIITLSLSDNDEEDVVVSRIGEIFTTDLEGLDAFHLFDPIDHFVAIMEKPLVGLGFGIPFKRTFLIREAEATFSHNAYLFVWGGMGLGGLIVYLLLQWRLIALARQKYIRLNRPILIPVLLSVVLTALAQGLYSTGSFTSSRLPFVLSFVMALIVKYRTENARKEGPGEVDPQNIALAQ